MVLVSLIILLLSKRKGSESICSSLITIPDNACWFCIWKSVLVLWCFPALSCEILSLTKYWWKNWWNLRIPISSVVSCFDAISTKRKKMITSIDIRLLLTTLGIAMLKYHLHTAQRQFKSSIIAGRPTFNIQLSSWLEVVVSDWTLRPCHFVLMSAVSAGY